MTRLRLSLLISLLAGAILACDAQEATVARSPRWIVIGIDGAEWSVIEALWEQGRLPHLERSATWTDRLPTAQTSPVMSLTPASYTCTIRV